MYTLLHSLWSLTVVGIRTYILDLIWIKKYQSAICQKIFKFERKTNSYLLLKCKKKHVRTESFSFSWGSPFQDIVWRKLKLMHKSFHFKVGIRVLPLHLARESYTGVMEVSLYTPQGNWMEPWRVLPFSHSDREGNLLRYGDVQNKIK